MTATTTQATKPTAAAAYDARVSSVCEKLARLQLAIAEHKVRQARDLRNWGYAGDMAHLDEKLAELLATLG